MATRSATRIDECAAAAKLAVGVPSRKFRGWEFYPVMLTATFRTNVVVSFGWRHDVRRMSSVHEYVFIGQQPSISVRMFFLARELLVCCSAQRTTELPVVL